MTVFFELPVLLALLAIVALHITSLLVKSIYGKIALYINITLHIDLFILLIFLGASMGEIALAFMISVFVYTLAALIVYKFEGRGEK